MPTLKKEQTIKELTDKVAKAKAVYVVDYRGIKHKQLEEFRKKARKLESEFVVTKNRFLKIALGDKAASLEQHLNDTSATLFAYADEVAPLKELLSFFKLVNLGRAKGGLLGANLMEENELTRLSTLPSKDVLLGTLVRQLNSPIQGLHYALSWNLNRLAWALNAVKEKKS